MNTNRRQASASRFFGAPSTKSNDTDSSSSSDDEIEVLLVIKPTRPYPQLPTTADKSAVETTPNQIAVQSSSDDEVEIIEQKGNTFVFDMAKEKAEEKCHENVEVEVSSTLRDRSNTINDVVEVDEFSEEELAHSGHDLSTNQSDTIIEEVLSDEISRKESTSSGGEGESEAKHEDLDVNGDVLEASMQSQEKSQIYDVKKQRVFHDSKEGVITTTDSCTIDEMDSKEEQADEDDCTGDSFDDVSLSDKMRSDLEKENEIEKILIEDDRPKAQVNPFALFAFGSSTQAASCTTTTSSRGTTENVRSRNWMVSKEEAPPKKKSKAGKKQKCAWIPLAELPAKEQQRVLRKWQGLSYESFSLEDRRFQVMVASRLHARCQETVVRKCMRFLREANVLTCAAMAEADPEVLASLLSSLQYYNTKSKHLVQSSNQLLKDFDGMVPESKEDLLKLTGIGPVMADLLSTINTRESYEQGE